MTHQSKLGHSCIFSETFVQAFVTLTYLNMIRMQMSVLPMLVILLVQAKVSMDRVNKYMNNEELSSSAVTHEPSEKDPVLVRDGEFKWGKGEKSILKASRRRAYVWNISSNT